MRNAWLVFVCLVIGCGGVVPDDGGDGEGGGEGAAVCSAPEDCDDGDPCTADRCSPEGECDHSTIGNCGG